MMLRQVSSGWAFSITTLLLLAPLARAQRWSVCNCPGCDETTWNRNAAGYSCGERIEYLMEALDFAPDRACSAVGGFEYPQQCGACNSEQCSPPPPPPQPEFYQAPSPNDNEGNGVNNGGGNSNGNDNGGGNNNAVKCGCESCTEQIWKRDAEGHSCGDRITFLMEQSGLPENKACVTVGELEFKTVCGSCNPNLCNAPPPTQNAPLPNANDNDNNIVNVDNGNNPILFQQYQPPEELYCFPPQNARRRYTNVWGKYNVEVKEGLGCGPSSNAFTRNTVSVSANKREVTLQLKKTGGRWQSSEVRVLHSSVQEYFDYGRYEFGLKSVRVVDSRNGQVVDTKLPPSVILGLFTWDATKNYAIHEDYNNEVDVELSSWDIDGNADAQFLVQPPGDPQSFRFFSGGREGTYQQAPHVYGFEWRPAEIEWFSSAGGGQSFVYNVRNALVANQPDYTQCMPARVEARINLWHLHGSEVTPRGLQDYHIVEVVVDNFQFMPSGLKAVRNGGICTKDCQCGESSKCLANRCASLGRSYMLHHHESNATLSSSSNKKSTEDTGSDGHEYEVSMENTGNDGHEHEVSMEDTGNDGHEVLPQPLLDDPFFFSLLVLLGISLSLTVTTVSCWIVQRLRFPMQTADEEAINTKDSASSVTFTSTDLTEMGMNTKDSDSSLTFTSTELTEMGNSAGCDTFAEDTEV